MIPRLLLAVHLSSCRYAHVDEAGPTNEPLSEHAASYAPRCDADVTDQPADRLLHLGRPDERAALGARRDADVTGHARPGQILSITIRGSVAAAKLDVIRQAGATALTSCCSRWAAGRSPPRRGARPDLYSDEQTTSPDDARTSTLSFWPSVYLRHTGSVTSQVP